LTRTLSPSMLLRHPREAGGATALSLDAAYALALERDPTLLAVRAATRAREERVPQARAQLMPNLSLSASRFRNDLRSDSPGLPGGPRFVSRQKYGSTNESLVLRQPLYRPFQLADLRQARAQVEEAHATLDFHTQDLAVRLAGAYLDVLGAEDQVALIGARKTAYTTTLDAARRRFAGG